MDGSGHLRSHGIGEWPCFASAAPGLEALLLAEIQALGAPAQAVEGGVELTVPLDAVPALLRRLRCASRFLVRLVEGRVEDAGAVTTLLDRVPWTLLPAVPVRVALRLSAQSARPERIRWLQVELLRQLAMRFGNDRVTTLAPTGEPGELALVARLDDRRCLISADAGGAPLYQRGYRLEAGPAPLRETLAAAMLQAAGWQGHGTLWDPMCGSGTIAIEAALWGRPLPRALRSFAVDEWRLPVRTPIAQNVSETLPRIFGGDLDADVLAIAQRNADRAGVADRIAWQHAEAAVQQIPDTTPGWVVTNPPYGHRLGGRNAARRLYERLGLVLARNCPGWRLALLAPERALATQLPLAGAECTEVDAGGLKIWLVTGEITTAGRPGRRRK